MGCWNSKAPHMSTAHLQGTAISFSVVERLPLLGTGYFKRGAVSINSYGRPPQSCRSFSIARGCDKVTSTYGRVCVQRFSWKQGFVGLAQSRGLTKPPLGRYRMRVGEGGSRGSETPAFHTLHFRLPPFFPWLPPFSQLLSRLPYPSRPQFARSFCPVSSPAWQVFSYQFLIA